MTKKKRYKRYSPEFKREALMRASEEGVTDVMVGEELDISARQLRRWRDEYRLLGDDAGRDKIGYECLGIVEAIEQAKFSACSTGGLKGAKTLSGP